MGLFDNIFNPNRSSPAPDKALAICQRLFNDEHIVAADIDALIMLGDAAIKTFRLILSDHDNQPKIMRQEQILDMLGAIKITDQQHSTTASTIHAPHHSTIIALLACFLDEPQDMLAGKIISYLVAHGSAATDVLFTALQNNHGRIRSHAAIALADCNDSRTTPLLIAALQDDDARVRSDVVESLGKLGQAQAIEALIHSLSDANWLVRASASIALASFGSESMIDELSLLLRHEKHQMRMQAIFIIQRIHNKQTLPLLISALDDPHSDVQWEAITALSTFHEAIIPLLSHYHQSNISMRQHIASTCNSIGILRVATQLSHHDPHIRLAVADILAQLDCTELLPLLADAWQHESNLDVLRQVLIAIAQLTARSGKDSPEAAITTLIQAAENPDQNMAYHARKALESLPHPLAEQFLQPPLQNSKIAINCPSCLQTLQLKPPLTKKLWSCPHCHLGFSIHHGTDDILMVTPATATVQGSALASHAAPWFEILHLNPDAETSAIKASFRTLLKQYHPDKVATLGTEFKQLAEEKTRLLTWALRTGLNQHKK